MQQRWWHAHTHAHVYTHTHWMTLASATSSQTAISQCQPLMRPPTLQGGMLRTVQGLGSGQSRRKRRGLCCKKLDVDIGRVTWAGGRRLPRLFHAFLLGSTWLDPYVCVPREFIHWCIWTIINRRHPRAAHKYDEYCEKGNCHVPHSGVCLCGNTLSWIQK